jgi:hypothetical protein
MARGVSRRLKLSGEILVSSLGLANVSVSEDGNASYIIFRTYEWSWNPGVPMTTSASVGLYIAQVRTGMHYYVPLHNFAELLSGLSKVQEGSTYGAEVRQGEGPSSLVSGLRVSVSASLSDCDTSIATGTFATPGAGTPNIYSTHKVSYGVIRFLGMTYNYPTTGSNVYLPVPQDVVDSLPSAYDPVISGMEIAPVWGRPEDIMFMHSYLLSIGSPAAVPTFNPMDQVVHTKRSLKDADQLFLWISLDFINPTDYVDGAPTPNWRFAYTVQFFEHETT